MDPKSQKYSNEFLASQPLKKMIPQLLLSVSLFSFVFSYSSLYSSSSSLAYSPKFHYFTGNSFRLLSNALNKNCLFLICNGLLVFLAKTSGLIRPPSTHDLNEYVLQKGLGDSLQMSIVEKYVLEESGDHETKEEEKGNTSESPKDVSIFIAESEEEGEARHDQEKYENKADRSRNCWLFDDDEPLLYEEEEVEAEHEEDENDYYDDEEEKKEEMSTEELNQKFEDFIRRMKEEILISEATQKVVMLK